MPCQGPEVVVTRGPGYRRSDLLLLSVVSGEGVRPAEDSCASIQVASCAGVRFGNQGVRGYRSACGELVSVPRRASSAGIQPVNGSRSIGMQPYGKTAHAALSLIVTLLWDGGGISTSNKKCAAMIGHARATSPRPSGFGGLVSVGLSWVRAIIRGGRAGDHQMTHERAAAPRRTRCPGTSCDRRAVGRHVAGLGARITYS